MRHAHKQTLESAGHLVVSREFMLPQNDRARERLIRECRQAIESMGFTITRTGHRTWRFEGTVTTKSMILFCRRMGLI